LSAPPTYKRTTYRQPVSRLWFLKKRTYFVFVLRELSSIFVGWSAVFLMIMLFAVGRGEAAYQNFLNWAASPVVVVVNVVALAFLVLHTVTWFALTPQAMEVRLGGRQVSRVKMVNVAGQTVPAATVVRVGGRRIPPGMIIASQYAGLIVVSAFLIWLVLR
jgi:fumarate reductase subunit C